MKIIDRVYDEMERQGIRQARLAEAIGVSTALISNWKKRGTDPKAIYIKPIADFLGVTEDYLLTGQRSDNVNADKDNFEGKIKFYTRRINELPESDQEMLEDLLLNTIDTYLKNKRG